LIKNQHSHDTHQSDFIGKTDHSTAGAQFAIVQIPVVTFSQTDSKKTRPNSIILPLTAVSQGIYENKW